MVSPAPINPSRGPSHYAWKGDAASKSSGRERARNRYPLTPCERCGKPGLDRHHVDGNTLNNAPANIQILCRRCHMEVDGRKDLLREVGAASAKGKAEQRLVCKNGHSLTEQANIYRRADEPRTRNCRRCRADAEKRRRDRVRAAALK